LVDLIDMQTSMIDLIKMWTWRLCDVTVTMAARSMHFQPFHYPTP